MRKRDGSSSRDGDQKRARRSRLQALTRPTCFVGREPKAVMETVVAVAPELDAVRNQSQTSPMRRARDRTCASEARCDLFELRIERGAAVDGPALRRRPGPELRA